MNEIGGVEVVIARGMIDGDACWVVSVNHLKWREIAGVCAVRVNDVCADAPHCRPLSSVVVSATHRYLSCDVCVVQVVISNELVSGRRKGSVSGDEDSHLCHHGLGLLGRSCLSREADFDVLEVAIWSHARVAVRKSDHGHDLCLHDRLLCHESRVHVPEFVSARVRARGLQFRVA